MRTDEGDGFRPAYQAAFSRYLSRPSEGGRAAAYEIGRSAVTGGVGLLDLSDVHHAALLRALKSASDPAEVEERGRAASEFFSEVLASFEMTQRGFVEGLALAAVDDRSMEPN